MTQLVQTFFPSNVYSLFFMKMAASLVMLLASVGAFGADFCRDISKVFYLDAKSLQSSRLPTQGETAFIESLQIDRLNSSYGSGAFVGDIDNDGEEELLAWTIEGTGMSISAGLYRRPFDGRMEGHTLAVVEMDLGILKDPQLIRFQGTNYIVSSDRGDDGLSISMIQKKSDRTFERRVLCHTHTTVRVQSACQHPACQALKGMVESKEDGWMFEAIEWHHKNLSPQGLSIYYQEQQSVEDFENNQHPEKIWRVAEGPQPSSLWRVLSLGKNIPKVAAELAEETAKQGILIGSKQERLRRSLLNQSQLLSRHLHRPVSLPNDGKFFLFMDKNFITYWAWDLGEPPMGDEIHILYTNSKVAKYIATVRLVRTNVFMPCELGCILLLGGGR